MTNELEISIQKLHKKIVFCLRHLYQVSPQNRMIYSKLVLNGLVFILNRINEAGSNSWSDWMSQCCIPDEKALKFTAAELNNIFDILKHCTSHTLSIYDKSALEIIDENEPSEFFLSIKDSLFEIAFDVLNVEYQYSQDVRKIDMLMPLSSGISHEIKSSWLHKDNSWSYFCTKAMKQKASNLPNEFLINPL